MPWGCQPATVGTSGPGKPNCGLPGTFGITSGATPSQVSSMNVGPVGRAAQS